MQGVGPASRTEFLKRKFLRGLFSVLCRCVVLTLALIARKSYEFPHVRTLLLAGIRLLINLRNHSRANRPAAFADSEL